MVERDRQREREQDPRAKKEQIFSYSLAAVINMACVLISTKLHTILRSFA